MPVVKLTGNPHTYAKMPGLMDFNAGVVVDGADIGETGRALYDLLLEVAGGRPTRSEENGDYEFSIPYEEGAVAGWRVGRRDMPGKEGGENLLKKGFLLPPPRTPTSSHLPKTFDWWGGGAQGVRSGLVLKKIPLRRTKEGYPRNLHYPIKRLLRRVKGRLAPASAPCGVQRQRPLPEFQGRSPWGFHTIIGDCAMTHCTACRAARPQSARLLSLFDSLGPIMSGPSSSHTAGMARIGRMGRSLVGGTPERITLHFFGALSHTYKGHGQRFRRGRRAHRRTGRTPPMSGTRCGWLRSGGVEVEIRTHPDSGRNPNTVSMELVRGGRTYAVAGVSVGGGEIEMTELEGFPVCLRGNEDGALFIGPDGLGRAVFEERLGALSGFSCVKDGERALYLCLAEKPFPDGMDMPGLEMFPVRNILGNKLADAEPLFSTLAAMAEMAGGDLPGLIERYEARRSGVDRDTIRAAVLGSWEIMMKASMTDGLAGKSDMLAGLGSGRRGIPSGPARRIRAGAFGPDHRHGGGTCVGGHGE